MNTGYNPEFNPTGIEGGVDTNTLPWIEVPQVPGMALKPLRASSESGMFSVVVKLAAGTELTRVVYLGAMDMIVLSGELHYPDGPLAGSLPPGTWGYVPANARVERMSAPEDTEFLANFYGPIAFLADDGERVTSVLTALDVHAAADRLGVALIPNTLAECMQDRPRSYQGPAEPLAIAAGDAGSLVAGEADAVANAKTTHPHFIDTRAVPWMENDAVPGMALKVLRVSEETGITSLIVRHNGVAGPHYHLGAADFMVLSGRIGYRAGPPEGYGPGVWFYEPAGARHEATQRIGEDEDLIYTANVYGPLQFDEGPGTPIVAVQSWMQYKELADAHGVELVRNTFEGDASLLAWTPVGESAAAL